MAAKLAAHVYNQKAVSVLGYVAQLVPPPSDIDHHERHIIHKILHIPHSMSSDRIFNLSDLNGPMFKSISVLCNSAMFRTAFSTISGWSELVDGLRQAACESLPARVALSSSFWLDWWDSQPMAVSLTNAFECSSGKPEVDTALRITKVELSSGCSSSRSPLRSPTKKKVSVQKLASTQLLKTLHPSPTFANWLTELCLSLVAVRHRPLSLTITIFTTTFIIV